MACIENKPTTHYDDEPISKREMSPTLMAVAVAGALTLAGLTGFFMTRPPVSTVKTPVVTPQMLQPAGQQGGGSQMARTPANTNRPPMVDGVPSAMHGMPGISPKANPGAR